LQDALTFDEMIGGSNIMATDWSVVKREHVIEACSLYDTERRIPPRPSRNTFLLLTGRRYPAKFIRGVAYQLPLA
jgi:hypothetical protein